MASKPKPLQLINLKALLKESMIRWRGFADVVRKTEKSIELVFNANDYNHLLDHFKIKTINKHGYVNYVDNTHSVFDITEEQTVYLVESMLKKSFYALKDIPTKGIIKIPVNFDESLNFLNGTLVIRPRPHHKHTGIQIIYRIKNKRIGVNYHSPGKVSRETDILSIVISNEFGGFLGKVITMYPAKKMFLLAAVPSAMREREEVRSAFYELNNLANETVLEIESWILNHELSKSFRVSKDGLQLFFDLILPDWLSPVSMADSSLHTTQEWNRILKTHFSFIKFKDKIIQSFESLSISGCTEDEYLQLYNALVAVAIQSSVPFMGLSIH